MARPIGIALVGAGFALRTQLPAFRLVPGAEVRVLVGRDPEATRAAAGRHGIPAATTRLEDALADADVDLVCVTTPPDLHRPMAEAALRAGKHVLCEKPMALDAAEAASMLAAARASDRLAIVDHELRFAPALRKLRRLVQDGYVGTPLHVQVRMLSGGRLDPQRPFNWWSEARRGGGALGAMGSHAVDWLRWMFGDIAAASGTLETFVRERPQPGELRRQRVDSDDWAAFGVRFAEARAPRATVLLSVVAHRGGGTRFEVHGSEGLILLDGEGRLWGSRREPSARSEVEQPPLEELGEPEPVSGAARTALPDDLWARAFLHLARELIAALAAGAGPLAEAADFEAGLAVQAVLDAVRRSHQDGAWVDCRPGPGTAPS